MEKKKKAVRYLKVIIITVIAGVAVMGAGMGLIYDKDRIAFDIQKLKQTLQIADALNLKVSFGEGYIVLNKEGSFNGPKIEIPTLKSADVRKATIELELKSMFFSEKMEIQRSAPPQSAPGEGLPGRIDRM